ncbi:MFS transporter [Lachnospiraceae bacterium ZAX-1]
MMKKRWKYLIVGVVMMLFSGIIYAWSILKSPLAMEFGWDNAALGLNFTITMACFCLGGILGSIITKKISPRITIMLSSLVIFTGFFLSSRMQGAIGVLYISYGGMCGLGIGVVYNVVISTVSGWFPDQRATASGALMMGFGASSLVLGSITGQLIGMVGWRQAYFLLGISILVILSLGAMLITPVPTTMVFPAKNERKQEDQQMEYTTGEMVQSLSFWKFYMLAILLSSIGSSVISFAKDVLLQVGAAETLAIILVGVLSVCNGLGRIVSGFLFDRVGRRKTMLLANAMAIIAPAITLFALVGSSIPLMILGMVVVGFSYGAMPPISSGFVNSFYGPKHFASNFGIANTMLVPASFSATISGMIVNTTGSFIGVFIMLLCFAVVGLMINLSLKK